MQRIILLLGILLYCGVMNAQLNLGVEAGFLHSTFSPDEYTQVFNAKGKNGFSLGLMANYKFKRNLSLESGLFIQRKGFVLNGHDLGNTPTHHIDYLRMDYLRVPLLACCEFKAGEFLLIPQAGAYLAIGLGEGEAYYDGLDKFGQEYGSRTSVFKDVHTGSAGYSYRTTDRLDYGLTCSLSLRYKHVGVRLGYDYGLGNACNVVNGGLRTLSLSLNYWWK